MSERHDPYKVLVTRAIPKIGLEMIREKCEVTLNPHDRVMLREEILQEIKGKEGLLCLLTDTIDEEIMDSSPDLRIISNYAVGYDNIDVSAASKRGILVTNTPGVLTETTADFAFALLMAAARRIPEADRFTRARRFRGWAPLLMLGEDVSGRTLGIIGMGRIGKAVAARASGFSMRVLYYDPVRLSPQEEEALKVTFVFLDGLLRESDFVSLHVPLTRKTRHLIGKRELSLMKQGSFLINTSRGPVVDEVALVEALRKGPLRGAALDVYENEPEIHPGLLDLENVILAPHCASASLQTRAKMATMAAENLLEGLERRIPPFLVNPEALKVAP